MDFKEIIKDLKEFRAKILQFMIVVLIAGTVLAYFRTNQIELLLACACAAVSVFLYKKHRDISMFIEFLEDNYDSSKNQAKDQDDY